ncbi:Tn3 family transposase [Pseudomonas aeruginosa]
MSRSKYNPKYGSELGRLFYTHISDQYAPFSTRVVTASRPLKNSALTAPTRLD